MGSAPNGIHSQKQIRRCGAAIASCSVKQQVQATVVVAIPPASSQSAEHSMSYMPAMQLLCSLLFFKHADKMQWCSPSDLPLARSCHHTLHELQSTATNSVQRQSATTPSFD